MKQYRSQMAYDAEVSAEAEREAMNEKPFPGDASRHCEHGTPDDTGCYDCFVIEMGPFPNGLPTGR